MAPVQAQILAQLRQLIGYHLDNEFLDNALFLAERFYALEPRNPDAIHLLALCHFRARQYKAAYDCTRITALKGAHLASSYIHAQACLALGRNRDGEIVLDRCRSLWERRQTRAKCDAALQRYVPDSAAVWCLLGKLVHNKGDVKRAVEYYTEALKLNPYMWDAFERLCDTGVNMRISNIFKVNPDLLAFVTPSEATPVMLDTNRPMQQNQHNQTHNNMHIHSTPTFDVSKPAEDSGDNGSSLGANLLAKMRMSIAASHQPGHSFANKINHAQLNPRSPSPSEDGEAIFGDRGHNPANLEPPNAPLRKTRTLQALGFDVGQDASRTAPSALRNGVQNGTEALGSQDSSRLMHHKRTISGTNSQANSSATMGPPSHQLQQRRSVRLFNQIRPTASKAPPLVGQPIVKDARDAKKAKATGTRGRSTTSATTVGRVVSGNRKPLDVDLSGKESRPASRNVNTLPDNKISLGPEKDAEALQWQLDLLGRLAMGYFELKRCHCESALQHFNGIPPQQRDTPWVLAQIGKAHYEQSNYIEAEKVFSRIRKMAPSRTKDMDIYSTVLWHLKRDTELAFLAHELVEAERTSPAAWCTIGNSFSLQRDHDQALKCFKRATQLDPQFAYGYTLQGHEHMSNEEYDKALLEYRKAVGADPRHYNGWYGLGKVYEKLGKYDMAEKHYRTASRINPTNSILVLCIGVVLEKLNKQQQALAHYNLACQLTPSSSITRFKKARVLLHLHRPAEALQELQILKDMAPEESNVHFMLGRVYKILGDRASAVRHFTIALNLDPKAAQYIKEAMESLDETDDDENGDEEML